MKATTYQYLHYGLKGYAIGWANADDQVQQISEHSGSAGTFYCYTLIDRKTKTGYIIVANIATDEAQESIYELVERLREK